MVFDDEKRELVFCLMDLLEQHLSPTNEIVFHDIKNRGFEHSIIDIRNGHITGRSIGGPTTNLGLEIKKGTIAKNNHYNYITYTDSGKTLRSSSYHFFSDTGELVASFCINTDITDTIKMDSFFRDYNGYHPQSAETNYASPTKEFFSQNVQQLLDQLIAQAINKYNKNPKRLSKQEKIDIVSFLDEKGAFFIMKSSEKICEVLGISKNTFYNYLDTVRKDRHVEADEKS